MNDHVDNLCYTCRVTPVVREAMHCGQKIVTIVWRCHQLLFGFLARGTFPRVSRESHLSVNDKADNEMIPGAVHRFPDICFN